MVEIYRLGGRRHATRVRRRSTSRSVWGTARVDTDLVQRHTVKKWAVGSGIGGRYPASVIDRSDWTGLVAQQRVAAPSDPPVIVLPLHPSPRGGSGTFLAVDNEDREWWVKPLNNAQSERVVVTESIVGAAGRLIGAPVCETAIVHIPKELEGWEFRPGRTLESGFAHASLAVEAAVEDRQLRSRDDDDNRINHVGVLALYDWCWGGDPQWLYSTADENRIFSHDHGWYLPEVGSGWTEQALVHRVDEPHEFNGPTTLLDQGETSRLARRLRSLTRADLCGILCNLPYEWPVTDSELECVGWFLERRAHPVARRLQASIGGF